jgi:cell division transport system permease protein
VSVGVLPHVLRRALRGISQSPFGALTVLVTIALALSVIGGLLITGTLLDGVLSQLDRGLTLSVYLADAADPGQRRAVADLVAGETGAPPRYVPKSEALARLRQELGDLGSVLDDLPENPLRDAYEQPMQGVDQRRISALGQRLRAMPGVVDVDDGAAWLWPLMRAMRLLRLLGVGLFALVTVATVVLTANTFRLSVYARREEIGILKLVGATDSYVRGPFIVEGLIEGSLGGGLAALLLGSVHQALWPRLQLALASLAPLGPAPIPVTSSAIALVLAGAAFGVLASGLSVGRFLRV